MLNIKDRDLIPPIIMKYQVISDQSVATFIVSGISEPIDATSIMIKYNRTKRKITESKFFNIHIRSAMIKLAKSLLEQLDNTKILVDQRDKTPITIFNDYFWSDNGTFLWSIEYTNRFCFQIHCQISVVL